MENEKKEFEEPVVEKVEFDFSDRIAASGCSTGPMEGMGGCFA